MAELPTAEDAAREILRIAAHGHRVRPGEVIMPQWLIVPFNTDPWRTSDLKAGLDYAVDAGWLTTDSVLTEAGFAAAE